MDPSAAPIETLSTEMWFEILIHLDFQSLMRVKRVSKKIFCIVESPLFQQRYLGKDLSCQIPQSHPHGRMLLASDVKLFFQLLRLPVFPTHQATLLFQSLRSNPALNSPAFSVTTPIALENYPSSITRVNSIATSNSNKWLAATFLASDKLSIWVFNLRNKQSWELGTIPKSNHALTFGNDCLYSGGANQITAWSLDPSARERKLNHCTVNNQKNIETLLFDESTLTGVSHSKQGKTAILWPNNLQQSSVTLIKGRATHLFKAHIPGMMYYSSSQFNALTDEITSKLIYQKFTCGVKNEPIETHFLGNIQCAAVHSNEESIFIFCQKQLSHWSPLTSTVTTFNYTTPLDFKPNMSRFTNTTPKSSLFFSNNNQEIYLVRIDGSLIRFNLETKEHFAHPNFTLAGSQPYDGITELPASHLTYRSSVGLISQKVNSQGQNEGAIHKHPSLSNTDDLNISRYIISPCGTSLIQISPTGISICNAVPMPVLVKMLKAHIHDTSQSESSSVAGPQ
ncbi:F-box protein [Pelagibaculum spongiae]|uniref:F-box domain-containing protein n=1 Tax=Pelagibaculum spongiae TaxID=2080658 RepID=A0A2V1GXR0_9GAMM|nr:F-box protein [Pelagibaculum spongiae]PVZ69788.1 hypothetical protein DC094_10895 [Pelagibaculum spongiae]